MVPYDLRQSHYNVLVGSLEYPRFLISRIRAFNPSTFDINDHYLYEYFCSYSPGFRSFRDLVISFALHKIL